MRISVETSSGFGSLSTIIPPSHWQQQHVHTKSFSKGEGDWDGAAFASHIRECVINSLRCLDCGLVVPVFDVRDPRLTTVLAEDAELVLCVEFGEFGFEVLSHKGYNLVWGLRRDQSVGAGISLLCPTKTRNCEPDAEFSRDLCGDNSLGPRTVESTLDTMDG